MKFAKPALALLVAVGLVGALAYALMAKPAAPPQVFTTLDGRQIALAEQRGKVVLVNFWATSCPGCVKEMPDMVKVYNDYRERGFEIVAVAMSYDPPAYVNNFVQTRQLPFPIVLDTDGAHAQAFGNVQVTPTSFVIGPDGRIHEHKLGEIDFNRLRALLDRELS
ncbi:MAG: TlpA disulfide reductase family protein [Pseudomonadota bacterium]